MSKDYDVIIVGAGPAGIFTALELFKLDSTLKVLMLDSGKGIKERNCPARKLGHCVHCNPCAIMSGWAGAGAFSDGKLSLSYEVGGNITRYIGESGGSGNDNTDGGTEGGGGGLGEPEYS